ncbi:hypothetical protein JD77_05050 [Micromonospora olivasterospora]|uniref:Uncharacterized protein n=1 Tax=Micromonospora olivasterospora TaxID=1880 RepID=A0A562IG84_MICOL|nr:hypothetical protein JD77_05050 [Micromonospora olivasterospora]
MPGAPAATACRASTTYVEKVVKPPSTPTPRNGRVSGRVRPAATRAMSAPISRQPVTLTENVAHGKPAGWCGRAA